MNQKSLNVQGHPHCLLEIQSSMKKDSQNFPLFYKNHASPNILTRTILADLSEVLWIREVISPRLPYQTTLTSCQEVHNSEQNMLEKLFLYSLLKHNWIDVIHAKRFEMLER